MTGILIVAAALALVGPVLLTALRPPPDIIFVLGLTSALAALFLMFYFFSLVTPTEGYYVFLGFAALFLVLGGLYSTITRTVRERRESEVRKGKRK